MSKVNHINNPSERLINQKEAERIFEEVGSYTGKEGVLSIAVTSWWAGYQRWGRNRVTLTTDQRDVSISITRQFRGGPANVSINQSDSGSLKGAVKYVEDFAARWSESRPLDIEIAPFVPSGEGKTVWSDQTFNRLSEENGTAVNQILKKSTQEQLVASGFIEAYGCNIFSYHRNQYGKIVRNNGRNTQAQCSITIRNTVGTASGWSGASSFDMESVDIPRISTLAFDKCIKSANPVRIEPGRYTSILEPAATGLFARMMMNSAIRSIPEDGFGGTWELGFDEGIQRFRTKLGLKVVDERITIDHVPTDPVLGTHINPGVKAVQIIERGVLKNLFNTTEHSLVEMNREEVEIYRSSFHFHGGNTSIEEMIASTQRGVLVSRFDTPSAIDPGSLLYTGVTRDGLWLIENGRVTKAIRNFRWTESPMFIFNNLVSMSESVSIFSPVVGREAIAGGPHNATTSISVPAVKVNDFSFTSAIDAI